MTTKEFMKRYKGRFAEGIVEVILNNEFIEIEYPDEATKSLFETAKAEIRSRFELLKSQQKNTSTRNSDER